MCAGTARSYTWLTDEELLSVADSEDNPTTLETELAKRLGAAINNLRQAESRNYELERALSEHGVIL